MWAEEATGRPLRRLEPEDIEARVAGSVQPIRSFLGPGDPLVLVLVMDAVGDLNRIDIARQRLSAHFDKMGEEWYVALLQAQDGLRVALDPTKNRRNLRDTLDALPVSGFPGLLDSVDKAAAIADSMLQGARVRVAVLYVTDGDIEDYRGDYASTVVNPSDSGDLSRRFRDRIVQEKMARLTASLQRTAAPLFFVHLEERTDSLNVTYQNGITQFAEATGGRAYFCRSVLDVALQLERVLEHIGNSYALTVELPANVAGQIAVQLEADKGLLHHRSTFSPAQGKTKRKKRR